MDAPFLRLGTGYRDRPEPETIREFMSESRPESAQGEIVVPGPCRWGAANECAADASSANNISTAASAATTFFVRRLTAWSFAGQCQR